MGGKGKRGTGNGERGEPGEEGEDDRYKGDRICIIFLSFKH